MLSGSWVLSPTSAQQKRTWAFPWGPSSEPVNRDVPARKHRGDAVDVSPALGRVYFLFIFFLREGWAEGSLEQHRHRCALCGAQRGAQPAPDGAESPVSTFRLRWSGNDGLTEAGYWDPSFLTVLDSRQETFNWDFNVWVSKSGCFNDLGFSRRSARLCKAAFALAGLG